MRQRSDLKTWSISQDGENTDNFQNETSSLVFWGSWVNLYLKFLSLVDINLYNTQEKNLHIKYCEPRENGTDVTHTPRKVTFLEILCKTNLAGSS